MNLPDADEEGWVTVEVFGKSDNTGKSSYLGQTQIYYYNNEKEVLKKIVQDEEQRRAFFESWKTACKGYSTDSREKETKSPSSGRHKRPLDNFHQSQVNAEFVVKISRRLM